MYDWAGQCARYAVNGLDSRHDQLAQLIHVVRGSLDDDVIGARDIVGAFDARDVADLVSHLGGSTDIGLHQNVCLNHVVSPPVGIV